MKTGTSGSVSSISPRRDEIDAGHPGEHGHRHDDGEDELRQVAAEVRLEPVGAARGRGRDLGGVGAVEGERLVAQAMLDEPEPQLREHARRRAAPGDLEAPAERGRAPRRSRRGG